MITVVDAKPMDQVGFRGVQAASPPPPPQKPAQTQEEPVKMRPREYCLVEVFISSLLKSGMDKIDVFV